jgi:hypothetical protein
MQVSGLVVAALLACDRPEPLERDGRGAPVAKLVNQLERAVQMFARTS